MRFPFPFRRRRRSAAAALAEDRAAQREREDRLAARHPMESPNFYRIREGLQPAPPQPEEIPVPVPELTPRERKLYRVSTKREHRTAGQLAVRANLVSSDGSGRGVVRDLNALVAAGMLVRHKGRDRSTYTRAA